MLDEWNAIYIKSDGTKVQLTWNELYVLEYMIDHKNRVTTIKELTEAVHGKDSYYTVRKQGITSYIKRIREKLKGEIAIINNPTIGYKIKYIGE